ncbi:histidine kinase [Flavobacterium sp. CBA20B-1]|uniref:histidine kinase n=1 Tax=unclassified Flavobacterium TaxID=196869 RepID=UPI002224C3EF|nr:MULTISPECIES: histidine kinase [unclassified Flavobacterium]WCM42660.1 histidine kinase [Flavobacterium sp. CBA20B-1]
MYNWLYRITLLCFIAVLISSCNKNKNQNTNQQQLTNKTYFKKIAALDCIPFNNKKDSIKLYLQDFQSKESQNTNIYYLLKTKWFRAENNADSTLLYFNKIKENNKDIDMNILKFLEEISMDYQPFGGVSYDKSAKILQHIQLAEQHNSMFTFLLYKALAEAYYQNNIQKESSYYNDLWFQNNPNKNSVWVKDNYYSNKFVIAYQMENIDSMKFYINKIKEVTHDLNNDRIHAKLQNYEAQYYYFKQDYKSALESSKKYFEYYKNNKKLSYENYHNLAVAFLDNNNLDSALVYFKKAYKIGKAEGEDIYGENHFRMLAEVYDKQGDYKNASIAKDSMRKHYYAYQEKIQNTKLDELKIQYETEKKETAIKTLESTNASNQKIISQQKWILAASGLAFLLVVLFMFNYYRQRVLSEKNKQLVLENKKLHLEQKFRQMQLNPHFIFNAVSNLQGLISSGNKRIANEYLVAFSKLMRNVLEHNRLDFISLDQEIETVQNYLKLQQIRYDNKFEYTIETNQLDTQAIAVPPMLLQPFVENAIEHGFKNISYKGVITISFIENNNQLMILIKDNGKGMNNTTEFNQHKKSLSKIIIQERIDILFNQKNKQSYIDIVSENQKDNTGILVKIAIPLLETESV